MGVSGQPDRVRASRDRDDFVSRFRSPIETSIHVLDEIDLDPELEDDVLAEWLLDFGKGSGR
jgi:hypothetical protein